MKIGNAKNAFTILMTTEDRNMLGTSELVLDIKMDSVLDFLNFYRVGHPHAKGTRVSIVANPGKDGNISHPYRILLNKRGSTGKWKFLNQLPLFSPEQVSLSADNASGHDPWTASRPAMTRISPQAKGIREKALEPKVNPGKSQDEPKRDSSNPEYMNMMLPPIEKVLPKVPAQIMTREEYSETAMYKSLMDGMALVNKAMAFYGPRLIIEQRNGKLVALVEVTGD